MVRKSYFIEMGGFDEALDHSWNDVDFGIRTVRKGLWVVYTPFALLHHYVGRTRGEPDTTWEEKKARARFRKKNIKFLRDADPFYNPNLSTYAACLYMPKCDLKFLSGAKVASTHQSRSA